MKFNKEIGPTLSSVLTIVVTVIIIASIVVFSKILKQARMNYEFKEPKFLERFGTLTEGLNTQTGIGTYWNVLILIRWILTTCVLIFLRDHCEFQILCLLISSITFQCLLLHGKPMPTSKENAVSVFNEFMVSLYLYTLLHLTDFFGENRYREEAGYALVGIILMSVAVNLLKFFTLIIREIRAIIQKKRLEKARKDFLKYQTLDVHQAKTLHNTPGIFAYNYDINEVERVAELKA